jgi:hypothetical protein
LFPLLVDTFNAVPSCANSICSLHFLPFQRCGSAILSSIATLIPRACAPHQSRSSQRPELQLPIAEVVWHHEGCNGVQPDARLTTTASMNISPGISHALTPKILILMHPLKSLTRFMPHPGLSDNGS